ncbi:MAG: ABC transporter permease [Gammaproteobacteria bacterium]|uniref:ABC transporter permease n=1 Tax=Methylotuvimicrobium sp. TaxID=2822413 RepID=UPI001E186CFE|nr:ABC transporter permease [Gammaproteobacteria bacterium]
MTIFDLAGLSLRTVLNQKLRSSLTALGLIIGIAAVVILTSIGQGIHRFVLDEFTQFGTNLLAITPGKTTTFGISGATISTVRPLTIDDAESVGRLPNVIAAMPMVQGNARVETIGRHRRANVFGVGSALPEIWKINIAIGRFLPEDDQSASRAFAVLGSKLASELFGRTNPLGERIRIGGDRYRVIGVMESKGQMLGFDLDDTVYIPADKALELFNRQSLMEIDVIYNPDISVEIVEQVIKDLLIRRHGFEDFTIITQNKMLETLDSVLSILTLGIGALGGISLLVGSVGILTIMTIAVSERISEIGLLRALGAERRVVFQLFLAEALALSLAGGMVGIAVGMLTVQLIVEFIPALPVQLAWGYLAAAFVLSLAIGMAAGVMPAVKAARLNPLEALRTE